MAPGGVLPGRAQPLGHQRDADDHVAEDHDRIVEPTPELDRGEHAGQTGRQDEHPDHLHQGDDPDDPVVGIVC